MKEKHCFNMYFVQTNEHFSLTTSEFLGQFMSKEKKGRAHEGLCPLAWARLPSSFRVGCVSLALSGAAQPQCRGHLGWSLVVGC